MNIKDGFSANGTLRVTGAVDANELKVHAGAAIAGDLMLTSVAATQRIQSMQGLEISSSQGSVGVEDVFVSATSIGVKTDTDLMTLMPNVVRVNGAVRAESVLHVVSAGNPTLGISSQGGNVAVEGVTFSAAAMSATTPVTITAPVATVTASTGTATLAASSTISGDARVTAGRDVVLTAGATLTSTSKSAVVVATGNIQIKTTTGDLSMEAAGSTTIKVRVFGRAKG